MKIGLQKKKRIVLGLRTLAKIRETALYHLIIDTVC